MSRNIKEANILIFNHLDRYCFLRGLELSNSTNPRWIQSKNFNRHFMVNARLAECMHFSSTRKLARFDISTKSYLFTLGFEESQGLLGHEELELNAAYVTVALSELRPKPAVSVHDIREVVEWSDKNSDLSYDGHDYERIAALFPVLRVYEVEHWESATTWNVFFRACVDECDFGSSWIEGDLADCLRTLCDLDQKRVPYKILCRSVFDTDQSTFFLALYRCLEALYAYSSAQTLARELNIVKAWATIATVLEEKLGWHPREEGSLAQILMLATKINVRAILFALEVSVSLDEELLINQAAKAIYKLRNSIVHYRPSQAGINMDSVNWMELCKALVGVVFDIYTTIFP